MNTDSIDKIELFNNVIHDLKLRTFDRYLKNRIKNKMISMSLGSSYWLEFNETNMTDHYKEQSSSIVSNITSN